MLFVALTVGGKRWYLKAVILLQNYRVLYQYSFGLILILNGRVSAVVLLNQEAPRYRWKGLFVPVLNTSFDLLSVVEYVFEKISEGCPISLFVGEHN